MRARRWFVVFAVCTSLLVATVLPAEAALPRYKVTISSYRTSWPTTYDGGTGQTYYTGFNGDLDSHKRICYRHRVVHIYRSADNVNWVEMSSTSGYSDDNGAFTGAIYSSRDSYYYLLEVRKHNAGHFICKRGTG